MAQLALFRVDVMVKLCAAAETDCELGVNVKLQFWKTLNWETDPRVIFPQRDVELEDTLKVTGDAPEELLMESQERLSVGQATEQPVPLIKETEKLLV
jgi:hypothetical protein